MLLQHVIHGPFGKSNVEISVVVVFGGKVGYLLEDPGRGVVARHAERLPSPGEPDKGCTGVLATIPAKRPCPRAATRFRRRPNDVSRAEWPTYFGRSDFRFPSRPGDSSPRIDVWLVATISSH